MATRSRIERQRRVSRTLRDEREAEGEKGESTAGVTQTQRVETVCDTLHLFRAPATVRHLRDPVLCCERTQGYRHRYE